MKQHQGLGMAHKLFKVLFVAIVVNCSSIYSNSRVSDFIDSFIKHYELTPEGRYVHEYHPLILQKTAESFSDLEKTIKNSGYTIAGRNVIVGYEEAAVPCYYTNFKQARINDEATVKSRAGWSLKLHNRFGIMTGYVLQRL